MEKGKRHSLRLFFALWPGAAERAALAGWQALLHGLCGGKAMRPDTLHATLVFLGDVAEDKLEALSLAGREGEFSPFSLALTEARYWGHNHILYAAPGSVPEQMSALVHSLERSLRRHRFRFDQREYQPHVTLLRHARWTDDPLPSMPAVHWRVQEFALVRSLSDASGARYEVLERFGVSRQGK